MLRAKRQLSVLGSALLASLLLNACSHDSPAPPQCFPERVTGDPNLDYWNFINAEVQFLRQVRASSAPGKDFTGALQTNMATRRMLRASVEGVDPELVAWSMRVAKWNAEYSVWLSLMADLQREEAAEKSQLSSDAVPPHRPWLAARMGNELIADDGAIRKEGLRLQQTLSQRYGTLFPPCSF